LLCIEKVKAGESHYSSKLQDIPESATRDYTNFLRLTPSEQKILRLIAKGQTSKEIADNLFVSYRTIEKHRSNIIQKLDLEKSNQKITEWTIVNQKLLDL